MGVVCLWHVGSEDDYECTFGGKTISAGLAIKVVPMTDVGAAPEIEMHDEVAALLDSDEVKQRS